MIPGSANALLLGSAAGGYTISRSLRFNSADSPYLSRTPASAGNRKTWTWAGWIKRVVIGQNYEYLMDAGASDNFGFTANSAYVYLSSVQLGFKQSTAVFRDPSAWLHYLINFDSTNATAEDRCQIWINGVRLTSWSANPTIPLNTQTLINSTSTHTMCHALGYYFMSAYLADIHFIDGQALDPTSFGAFSATTGVWMPKRYTGSYGTNGFKLNFSDNSAATATTLGKDSSGNGNNWTPNNLSVTAGAGNDSLVDVPTNGTQSDTGAGGEVRGNYCTLNPLQAGANSILTNGNLDIQATNALASQTLGTVGVSSGKWYFEATVNTYAGAEPDPLVGISNASSPLVTNYPGQASDSYAVYCLKTNSLIQKVNNGSFTNTDASQVVLNDIISVAFDLDAGKFWVAKNGTWIDSGNPASGVNPLFSGLSGSYLPTVRGAGSTSTAGLSLNFGQRPFAYTAPSGFKALCTANLPAPTIVKPSTVMDVVTYTGTGSTLTPTSTLGFNPDLIWIKSRSAATDHALYDSVRGTQARLESNTTDAEVTSDSGVTAFNTAGFTLGTLAQVNTNAATYAAWTWDAGSSTVTNTAGTISSQVRANASAGFSIVTYTGNGVTGATVGHGLGVTPSMVILKRRDVGSTNWYTYHSSIGNTGALALNATSGTITSGNFWNNTSPTSTLITISATGGGEVNGNGGTFVLYCFAPVAGYSAFGSYTGNGSADGPFVYLGFRPRWVMVKASSSTGSWYIYDSRRDTYNVATFGLFPNVNSNELSIPAMDLLSNGFKLKYEATYGANYNGSGVTYVYAAFAENPFSLARAR